MEELNRDQLLIPALRKDISVDTIEQNGEKILVLSDPTGYASQPMGFPEQLTPLLNLFNGQIKVGDLRNLLRDEKGNPVDIEPVLDIVLQIDSMGYMETADYKKYKENLDIYQNSDVRQPVCAGNSYPAEPVEAGEYLSKLLDSVDKEKIKTGAKAIIVPHIDFLVGKDSEQTYATGYAAIRDSRPDLVVILGTAHFVSDGFFMFTEKNYNTPFGAIETDRDIINKLKEKLGEEITISEMAHFKEHSVELQAVLVKKLFGDKVKILPVLCGSVEGSSLSENEPIENEKYKKTILGLTEVLNDSGKNVLYIASVDFGHIGRRFGHGFNAVDKLEDLKKSDRSLIERIRYYDSASFFQEIKSTNNFWNVCGVAPIYSIMNLVDTVDIEFLEYRQWDDRPTDSAVSFASFALY